MKRPYVRELLCCICKKVPLGTKEVFVDEPIVDPVLACGACHEIFNKFRVDVGEGSQKEAARGAEVLCMRGATMLALHDKILDTNPAEAAKLAGMTDIMGAIKGGK